MKNEFRCPLTGTASRRYITQYHSRGGGWVDMEIWASIARAEFCFRVWGCVAGETIDRFYKADEFDDACAFLLEMRGKIQNDAKKRKDEII